MKVKLIEETVGIDKDVYSSLEDQLNKFCKNNDVVSIQIMERNLDGEFIGLVAYVCYNEIKCINKLNQKVLDQIEASYDHN